MQRKVTIAGGGLAGLTAGLLLRREGVPVEIHDAGTYPRHRVCGEFISGRGLEILHQLGLPDFPAPAGRTARSVRFYYAGWRSSVISLPEPALSIDRSKFDYLLAGEFRRRGGVLHERSRWTEGFEHEGLVRATGRKAAVKAEPRFVGFKVHARGIRLEADLELHFSPEGYVGLSGQNAGTVNICGLFRKTGGFRDAEVRDGTIFRRIISDSKGEALGEAQYDRDSFCAVAGISLKRETTLGTKECRIGDSICMIPPLTGNGMSLAVESAALAAPILARFSAGLTEWEQARRLISQNCDAYFRGRLRFAAILQKFVFARVGRAALLSTLKTWPGSVRWMFGCTR